MNGIRTVAGKELARVFGDKKLIFSLFIMPAVLMLVLYTFMGKAMSSMMQDIEEHESIVYIQNAPEGFDAFLQGLEISQKVDYNVTDEKQQDMIKQKIKEGSAELLLVFPENFKEAVDGYSQGMEIPEIRTFYNPSEDYSSEARNRYLNTVLPAYKETLLAGRFADLQSLTVFQVDTDESASIIMDESKAGGKMLGMLLPYLIVMLLFTGPMSLGVDAITGEKERGTMASMLVSPVKRSEIVVGKIIALSILSCLSAIVYAVSMIISLPKMFAGAEGEPAMSAKFSAMQMLQLLLIMLTLVYFYVALVTLISVFAKTAKEAGTYISPVYIVVIVAGVLTMFSGNNEVSLPLFAVPVYGSAAAIQRVITGELTGSQFGIALLGTAVFSVILTGFITKAFNSEKVMFNA